MLTTEKRDGGVCKIGAMGRTISALEGLEVVDSIREIISLADSGSAVRTVRVLLYVTPGRLYVEFNWGSSFLFFSFS